ncbi:PfkB family carbohydrate kinase [Tundrisphaera lichenicola]|uniref:PfkB family carbohydrate kinase n=1 Tax=Tundrisphaera lichenicola TaxID=2029860 RepID=UPI003EB7706E
MMPVAPSREQICRSTAEALSLAVPGLPEIRAVLGFDGFVDEIIEVVDTRHDAEHYDPVSSIAAMARKILGASGESSNYEMVIKQRKLGGNGPIMANALARLGLRVTYIGSLGVPEPDPVFRDFAGRAELISIANPGHTDALEFADGKLMLCKLQSLSEVTWENLVGRVGRPGLSDLMGRASLIGMLNWTMLPGMGEIWDRLLVEVFPTLPEGRRTLFVDLADPEKRTRGDLQQALGTITRFQERVDVILGLNLKEATQVAEVLGLPEHADREAIIEEDARSIRQALGLSCVVIHPRKAAAAATSTESALFFGPFIANPRISTGAGDHFNAGFCLGRILGMGLAESLCAGVASSGYYVRNATSASAAELADFVIDLPMPQE